MPAILAAQQPAGRCLLRWNHANIFCVLIPGGDHGLQLVERTAGFAGEADIYIKAIISAC